jgi:chromatin segregation and condensation protein Rec8/ScpA/Scc1 (kleisin family)
VYRPVPRGQIVDILTHLRDLFREVKASNEQEARAHERREIVTKNLLSNLSRLKEHPTLHAVLEVSDIFSLTLDGAHRIFGYNLEGIRDYDVQLNGGRTHITGLHQRCCPGEVDRSLGTR